jgi:hypothetical protein
MTRQVAMAGLAAVLTMACGSMARVTSATSPSPGVSAPPSVASTPTPTPTSTPAGTRLTITGSINGSVNGATAFGQCGRAANGEGGDLRFQFNGLAYSLSITVAAYHGPGSYPLPPDRVSLHTLGIGPGSQFFGSTSGTVTVSAGDSSGTVDAQLTGDNGAVHVTGTWSCAS